MLTMTIIVFKKEAYNLNDTYIPSNNTGFLKDGSRHVQVVEIMA